MPTWLFVGLGAAGVPAARAATKLAHVGSTRLQQAIALLTWLFLAADAGKNGVIGDSSLSSLTHEQISHHCNQQLSKSTIPSRARHSIGFVEASKNLYFSPETYSRFRLKRSNYVLFCADASFALITQSHAVLSTSVGNEDRMQDNLQVVDRR